MLGEKQAEWLDFKMTVQVCEGGRWTMRYGGLGGVRSALALG